MVLDPLELLLVLQIQYQPHYSLEVLALETLIVSLQTIQFWLVMLIETWLLLLLLNTWIKWTSQYYIKCKSKKYQINHFKYDDYNRRVLVDPVDFTTSGVSTTSNEITLTSHGLKSGDKVLHTATVPSVGLSSDKLIM